MAVTVEIDPFGCAHPSFGGSSVEQPAYRELVIAFGRTGCTASYRWDAVADAIFILAFRHQPESGY